MSRQHQRSTENKNKVEKRHRQSEQRRERNQSRKSAVRTAVTRTRRAIAAGDLDAAVRSGVNAASALDKAASKGVIHPNNAARRKSRLMKALAKAAAASAKG
ncbi:MAG: 30S ribosomal protein S20 [Chloroflexota bacterium]|nr:30S ribosomal protein S20 [Chloroflexota bacterium]